MRIFRFRVLVLGTLFCILGAAGMARNDSHHLNSTNHLNSPTNNFFLGKYTSLGILLFPFQRAPVFLFLCHSHRLPAR